jgi:AcrR family transcriptional regulator
MVTKLILITVVVNRSERLYAERMAQPRAYAGRTLDERRDARRAQLIETGLDCLHEEGLSGISVRTICSRARLTPRYFYESFANLDELLVTLVDHVGDQVAALSVENLVVHAGDVEKQVREALRAVFDVVLADPRKASVLLAAAAHEAMQARQQQRFLEFSRISIDFLSGAEHLDPKRLQPVALFMIGGAVELISAKLSGLMDLSDDELVERCVELFLAGWTAAGVRVNP